MSFRTRQEEIEAQAAINRAIADTAAKRAQAAQARDSAARDRWWAEVHVTLRETELRNFRVAHPRASDADFERAWASIVEQRWQEAKQAQALRTADYLRRTVNTSPLI